jgi:hypothetical protein
LPGHEEKTRERRPTFRIGFRAARGFWKIIEDSFRTPCARRGDIAAAQ